MVETVIINHKMPEMEPVVINSRYIFTIAEGNEGIQTNLMGDISNHSFASMGQGIRTMLDMFSKDKGIKRSDIFGWFMEGFLDGGEDTIREQR